MCLIIIGWKKNYELITALMIMPISYICKRVKNMSGKIVFIMGISVYKFVILYTENTP